MAYSGRCLKVKKIPFYSLTNFENIIIDDDEQQEFKEKQFHYNNIIQAHIRVVTNVVGIKPKK